MQPKLNDGVGKLHQFAKTIRFSKETGGPELIGSFTVLVERGGRQHNDRDLAELFVTSDLLKSLQTQHAWHIEVEQDQRRKVCFAGIQRLQQRFSVFNKNIINQRASFQESIQYDLPVVRVVIYNKDEMRIAFHN